MLRKLFDFILFSSLYISSCAMLMVWQTCDLLLRETASWNFLWFVFFSTVSSYNLHWYLTPRSSSSSWRIAWAQQHKGWHFALFVVGALGSLVFFLVLRQHFWALSFAAFLTFLYTAPKLPQSYFKYLKQIAVGKTIFLAMVWTYVTTVLPLLMSETSWKTIYLFFVCSRYFLIYSICILFDYRDRDDDKTEGIRSFITYLDEKGIDRLFMVSISLYVLSTMALFYFGIKPLDILVLLTPGFLVASIYKRAKTDFSDYLYYFVLDGLMALSSALSLMSKI